MRNEQSENDADDGERDGKYESRKILQKIKNSLDNWEEFRILPLQLGSGSFWSQESGEC